MADKFIGLAPFAYDTDYYVYTEKEQAEKEKFVSFMTQRNADYLTPAEEVYNNKHLEDAELKWEAFRDNIEPPTPQIKRVDGYDSAEEASGSEDNGGCDDTGDDNTGGDDNNGENTGGEDTGGDDNNGGENTGDDNTGGEDNGETPTEPEEPENDGQ